ncbi:MAG: MmcQ/YjbR family DNA-binding protein [Mucinivorans sp.]
MNIEQVREYCLGKSGAIEMRPFDPDTLVYKVARANGKERMFALMSLQRSDYVTLKCDPELAVDLRDRLADDVQGAWHFNKRHWNQIRLSGLLSDRQIQLLIDHSYDLVLLASRAPELDRREFSL